MIVIERQVTSPADPARVFAYLSDFTTTTEWDPGTVTTVREAGDGGVGTTYRNTSTFAGRQTQLLYTVVRREPPRSITLRGENRALTALDTITVESAGTGSRVTYHAEFRMHGVWRVLSPLLRPAFRRLGDEAEVGLREALAHL